MFISIEGIDGSGKTTLAKRLGARLQEEGTPNIVVRAPGQTPIGAAIRDIVLNKTVPIGDLYTRQLLFIADHLELYSQVIAPALEEGLSVICDRFLDSTTAYACGGLELEEERLYYLMECVWPIPGTSIEMMPDAFLLDVTVPVAMGRLLQRGIQDKADEEKAAYYERVRHYYHELVEDEPYRWEVVNAMGDLDETFDCLYAAVARRYQLPLAV